MESGAQDDDDDGDVDASSTIGAVALRSPSPPKQGMRQLTRYSSESPNLRSVTASSPGKIAGSPSQLGSGEGELLVAANEKAPTLTSTDKILPWFSKQDKLGRTAFVRHVYAGHVEEVKAMLVSVMCLCAP